LYRFKKDTVNKVHITPLSDQTLTRSFAVGAEALSSTHHNDLDGQRGQDALGMHQVFVAQVVQATLLEDLGTSLEPKSNGCRVQELSVDHYGPMLIHGQR